MKGHVMATWKDFAQKKANWLTDTLVVSPLTSLYRKQNEAYKAEQAANAVKPKPAPAPKPKPAPAPAPAGRHDALVRLAQGVSNSYQRGSLGRSKFYHGGNAVAR